MIKVDMKARQCLNQFVVVGLMILPALVLWGADSDKFLKDTPFEQIVAKAKAGDPAAQLYLAQGHRSHLGGVPYNLQESHRWYVAAATNNVAEAQFYMGNYFYGEAAASKGVGPSEKAKRLQSATASLVWLMKAAKQGYIPAWVKLGEAFDDGKVFTKDPVEAYKWYHLVIEKGGNPIGAPVAQRNALSLRLTPEQIESAKQRALAFWQSLGEEKKPTAPK